MATHLITVLIPSYNHEKYILDCLSKAVEIESSCIYIIDDGSTDDTASVVQSFIGDYKGENELRLIEKSNEGLVSSLNIGLKLCTTKYFYLVASDDIPDPKGINKLIDVLEVNINYQFAIGGASYFGAAKLVGSVYAQRHQDFFADNYETRVKSLFLSYPDPLLLQSTVFRASTLKAVGGWDKVIMSDDYQMFVRLLLKHPDSASDFCFMPKVNCVMYRLHDKNSYRNTFRQFNMICQVLNEFCPDEIKSRSIGKVAAYHILISIKKMDIRATIRILKLTPLNTLGWLSAYSLALITLRIVKYKG